MSEALKKAAEEPKLLSIHEVGEPSISPLPPAAAEEPAGIKLTPEQLRARRGRSIAIALALGAFVAVIFAVTIVRLGSAVLERPTLMRPPGATATFK
ncbi:MAG: hypothetical protein ACRECV_06550 [Xanthobacteraceae bacterium]